MALSKIPHNVTKNLFEKEKKDKKKQKVRNKQKSRKKAKHSEKKAKQSKKVKQPKIWNRWMYDAKKAWFGHLSKENPNKRKFGATEFMIMFDKSVYISCVSGWLLVGSIGNECCGGMWCDMLMFDRNSICIKLRYIFNHSWTALACKWIYTSTVGWNNKDSTRMC